MSRLSDLNAAIATAAANTAVTNYLKPNSFKFVIARAPNVTYTCQSANLPAIQLGAAMQVTPFVDVPHPGDKVNYGEFTIRFLINEDMSNYKEISAWIEQLGTPYSGDQYAQALRRASAFTSYNEENYQNVFSDAALLILDSDNIPIVKLVFQDLFPISIEALDFDITTAGMEYFVGIAAFRYKLFTIESI
jgi:hypothetical protein